MTEPNADSETTERVLTPEQVSGAIEAMLIMAAEPMSAATISEALQVPLDEVAAALVALQEFYHLNQRGFELRHVGGGWRYWTRPEYAEVISRWVLEGQHGRLSQAALETLSVIAYLQPISRSRVSAVRGVNVDGVVRTLLARELIYEVGSDEQTGASMLATTDHFLERLGLETLDELPDLAPYLPDATDVEAELEMVRSQGSLETTSAESAPEEPGGDDPGTAASGPEDSGSEHSGPGISSQAMAEGTTR